MEKMMCSEEHEERKAGRPRSVEAQQAILDATLALLSTHGFEGMSIEEVAARAGVGKTTIYRWWDSKEALALEALQKLYVRQPIVDTGDLRHDLVAMLEDVILLHEKNTALFDGLMCKLFGELRTRPELFQKFYERILEPRLLQFSRMIEGAQQRGELRTDLDPPTLLGLFGGSFLYRMLLADKFPPRGPCWAEQVVDVVLNGLALHGQGCQHRCAGQSELVREE